jgi:hypothetical protein
MTTDVPEDFVDFVQCLREDLADVATLEEIRDRPGR